MRSLRAISVLIGLLLLVGGAVAVSAQEPVTEPPVVDILGKADSRSEPPNAHAFVSVVDRPTGRTIDGLGADSFAVSVSDEALQPSVSLETTGLAVVLVIDRGGIAQRNDPRIGEAVDLADAFLALLTVDGSPQADMVALIGIRGKDQGGLTPLANFTDYDPIAIRNEFDGLRTTVVDETTPLYDGLDQAIAWIANNPDPALQDKLTHRRRVILVFSDGIDRDYSNESHETLIVNQAQANDILIYTIQMNARGRTADAESLNALAVQSHGAHLTHSEETHEEVLARFQDIVTQRQAYRVTFPMIFPQGDYQFEIRVLDTAGRSASDREMVSSRLQRPQMVLNAPPQLSYIVPYSITTGGFLPVRIPFSVRTEVRDGATRDPVEVSYFANEARLGTVSSAPDFPFEWDVTNVEAPSDRTITRTYTLIARATDPYLDVTMESQPVDIQVVWEQKEITVTEEVVQVVERNWLVFPLFGLLGLGLLLVLVLLVRTRGEVAKRMVKSTTGALKGMTQRLGAGGMPPARGKLVIVQGPRAGTEFRLAASIVKVGRDPQFGDLALQDQYVSNPHFSIVEEGGQFYVQDEGSTNGTRLNGVPISAHQRAPLAPDSIVEVGQTRVQFKRLGGPTRQLSGGSRRQASAPPAGDPALSPTQYAPPASPQQAASGQGAQQDDGLWRERPTQVRRPDDR